MDTRTIERTITEHPDYIGADYRFLPPDEFAEAFGELPTARFGWTFPEIGFLCPEIITAQTATLPSDEVDDYLRTIVWICDRHIYVAHHQPELSVAERQRLLESELFDKGPDSLRLMSKVELVALDG